VNVRAAHFPGFPLSLRFGHVVRAGHLRVCPRKPQNFALVVCPWKPLISFGRIRTCRVWVIVQTGGSGRSRVFVSTHTDGSFMSSRSGGSFGRGRTRANDPVSKNAKL